MLDGVAHVGLEADELERLAGSRRRASSSAPATCRWRWRREPTGGTTVAATALLASQAGIRVFATGGIGGVHRNARSTFDESADLGILAAAAITVVSGGRQVDPRHRRHARAARDPERHRARVRHRPLPGLLADRQRLHGRLRRSTTRRGGRRGDAGAPTRSACPAGSWSPTLCREPRSWTPPCTTGCSRRRCTAAEAGSVRGKDDHAVPARLHPRAHRPGERRGQPRDRPWQLPARRRHRAVVGRARGVGRRGSGRREVRPPLPHATAARRGRDPAGRRPCRPRSRPSRSRTPR